MSGLFKIFRKSAPRETLADRVCRAMATPKRLLLVEDNSEIVETFAHATEPYAVDLVGIDSVAGARYELEHDGPFDAAILDVKLVNGDGVSLYREIVKNWPQMSVVFMTGYDHPELRAEIEQVGPARVYPKTTVLRADFFEKLLAVLKITKRCLDPIAL